MLPPKFSLFLLQDSETNNLEWNGLQIAKNTHNLVYNNELPRSLMQGFASSSGEPYHCNSNNTPILKPNFICVEENGRHCYVIGMNSNYCRIPSQTLVKDFFIQLLNTSNLIHLHSLNPIVPIIEHAMSINVKGSHPIILGESLYCLGGCSPSNWASSMNIITGQWISIPNPPYFPQI